MNLYSFRENFIAMVERGRWHAWCLW